MSNSNKNSNKKKRVARIVTFAGCERSDIGVIPNNWQSNRASTKKPWVIHYRFYDNGRMKQVQIRGMNGYKELAARQAITKALIDQEIGLLDQQGWNPIRGEFMIDEVRAIMPHTPALRALSLAAAECYTGRTLIDVKSLIRQIEKAVKELDLLTLPVSDVRPKHLIAILNKCAANNALFSPHRHNLCRAYLMRLFRHIRTFDAIESNPVPDVPRRKETRKMRDVVSEIDRQRVKVHLSAKHPNFWRFVVIFFHSGARVSELMQVRRKDVDLQGQTFKVTVNKGKDSREVRKTIKDVALPYWIDLCEGAKPTDYLFSKHLQAGQKPIRPDQVTRRWEKYVKDELGIGADLYSLKHLNTSETVEQLGEGLAAMHNSHTSTAMVRNVYDVGRESREHEKIKSLKNDF